MTTLLIDPSGRAHSGRIAALSFRAARWADIAAIEGVGEEHAPPRTTPLAAWNRAAIACQRPGLLVRRAGEERFEFVREVFENDPNTGKLVGVRTTLGTIERGAPWPWALDAYGDEFNEHYNDFLATVDAAVLGNWAEKFAKDRLGAIGLATRGHLLHVTAQYAATFDRWIDAMERATGSRPFIASTVDDDPVTLLSLAESLRVHVGETIERERARAAEATTERGIEGARRRLSETNDALSRYRGLLGEVVSRLEGELATCAEGLAIAEVRQAFPDAAGISV